MLEFIGAVIFIFVGLQVLARIGVYQREREDEIRDEIREEYRKKYGIDDDDDYDY